MKTWTSTDANLIGASDEAQIAFACSERRVIVSHDRDLLRLNSQGVRHAGIAYCPPASRTIGQIVRLLILMHECVEGVEMVGRVQYL